MVWSGAVRLWLAVASSLLLFGEGCECGPPTNPPHPCERCLPFESSEDAGSVDASIATDMVCYYSCGADEDPTTCTPRPRGCVRTCDAANPCTKEGHPCVPYEDLMVCSFECVPQDCGPRSVCRGRDCEEVDCAVNIPCLSSTDICDPVAHACYPFDGTCNSIFDCPIFGGHWLTHATLDCVSGYCSIQPRPPTPPPGLPDVAPIGVVTPAPGTSYPSEDELEIRWASDFSSTTTSTLVLILDGYPELDTDLVDLALWGAALGPGEQGPLHTSEGERVV